MDNEFNFSSNISNQLISQYGKYLLSKIAGAQHVPFLDVLINGENAKRKECHKNATCFSEENESFKPVHGWLIIDARPMLQSIKFIAHSVVKNHDEILIDITPYDASGRYLFLPAFIKDEDFGSLVSWLHQNQRDGSFNYQIT